MPSIAQARITTITFALYLNMTITANIVSATENQSTTLDSSSDPNTW